MLICTHLNCYFPLRGLCFAQALDEVQRNLDGLCTSCSQITTVLSNTKSSTSQLLSETERLQRDLEGVERKSQLINEFLEQYQLLPEEVRGLGCMEP